MLETSFQTCFENWKIYKDVRVGRELRTNIVMWYRRQRGGEGFVATTEIFCFLEGKKPFVPILVFVL